MDPTSPVYSFASAKIKATSYLVSILVQYREVLTVIDGTVVLTFFVTLSFLFTN